MTCFSLHPVSGEAPPIVLNRDWMRFGQGREKRHGPLGKNRKRHIVNGLILRAGFTGPTECHLFVDAHNKNMTCYFCGKACACSIRLRITRIADPRMIAGVAPPRPIPAADITSIRTIRLNRQPSWKGGCKIQRPNTCRISKGYLKVVERRDRLRWVRTRIS